MGIEVTQKPQQGTDTTQGDWEDEGGPPLPEPTQKSAELPVPKRKAVLRVFEKAAKAVSGRGTDSPTSEK
jgi:hypothetical protein